ncbi:MAG: ATP-binding protein [Dichotomicrobium sp.]
MEAETPELGGTPPGAGWHISPQAEPFAEASRMPRFWLRWLLPLLAIALLLGLTARVAVYLIEAREAALQAAEQRIRLAGAVVALEIDRIRPGSAASSESGDGAVEPGGDATPDKPVQLYDAWRAALSEAGWALRSADYHGAFLVDADGQVIAEQPVRGHAGAPASQLMEETAGFIRAERALAGGGQIVVLARSGTVLAAWLREIVLFGALGLAALMIAFGMFWLFLRQLRRHTLLVRSAEAFRADMDSALHGGRAGLCFWDIVRGELRITGSVFTALGLDAPDSPIKFSRLRGLLHPEDDLYSGLNRAMKDGARDFAARFRMADAQGDWVWFEMRGQIIQGGWQATPNFLGMIMEVPSNERRESRDVQMAARLSEALDSEHHALALWDSSERLVFCNHKFLELYGLSSDDAPPGTPHADLQKAAERAVPQGPRSAAGAPKSREASYEIELDDGRWIAVSERRTRTSDFVSIATDITKLKRNERRLSQSERELRASVQELEESRTKLESQTSQLVELADKYAAEKARAEEASKSKSEFLANISHELRTPLNAIIGFSEVMTEEFFGPIGHEKYRDYAKDISESGRYLLEMIDDILDMSKIEAGQFSLSIEQVRAGNLIEDSLRVVQPTAEERNIDLSQSGNPDINIAGDKRALKQVLLNLLSNAVKFTPEGGGISVRSYRYKGTVRIAIADSGVGIPRHEIAKLGKPFKQVGNQLTRDHKGSGLGLAISRSILEMHEGRLDIKSKSGEGTTVTCILPQSPSKEAGNGAMQNARSTSALT